MAVSRFELPGDGLLAAQLCLGQRMPAGDPARIRGAARRSDAQAGDLRRVAATLLSNADTPRWSGSAHRAFVEDIRAHAPSMTATAERYERYAAALHAYAGALDETAPRMLAARSQLRQRYDELARAGQPAVSLEATALPGRTSPHAAELLPLARAFKAGYDQWADALSHCVQALIHADEADPTRDAQGIRALGQRLAAAAHQHLSPFARAVANPSLANISDCLSTLTTDLTVLGLGLLLICPPAATACLAAATLLALTQLTLDATRRAQGEHVSTTHLGLQLAAAIPVGGPALRGLRAADNAVRLVPGGGLKAHEGIGGGHTLAKHVGKTEHYLRNRLATEPGISAASTFHNRQAAEASLSKLIHTEAREIDRWLRGSDSDLLLKGRATHSIGFVITRGATRPIEACGIRLVLRRSSAMNDLNYRIHTAMVTL